METVKDISALSPAAQKACRLFMQRCKERGLPVYITETYRSQERQNELYAQGRTKPGKVVTWTKNSRHKSRRAWDICKMTGGKADWSDSGFFKACGAVARGLGITWGGEWKMPDMPHFEIGVNWKEPKGDDSMTAEEKREFNLLKARVEELEGSRERIYHWTAELPDWAKLTIEKLLQKGIYKGKSDADLNLPESLARVLVINDRAGMYK